MPDGFANFLDFFFFFLVVVMDVIKYLLYSLGSVVYVISAPMSPIFGLLVDKTGKNVIWVLCAVVTTLASHILLAFTLWNPWIAMVMLLLTPGGHRGQGGGLCKVHVRGHAQLLRKWCS